MEQLSLGVPKQILESLPNDDDAATDMKRAVAGLESNLNAAIEAADSESEAASRVADAIEHLEDRMERYDEFVPELRAWGQSPIYAIAWRNLQADLVMQIRDHEWLTEHLDKERNYRLVEDGIRFGKR
jgi:hypothetical protein